MNLIVCQYESNREKAKLARYTYQQLSLKIVKFAC